MTTLDSVVQAPVGPEEDTPGGIEYGGNNLNNRNNLNHSNRLKLD